MQSGTYASTEQRPTNETYTFPPFSHSHLPVHYEDEFGDTTSARSPSPAKRLQQNGVPQSTDRWRPRRDSNVKWDIGGTRHGRQKSLSEALRTIRTRRGSVSENAHEIADALKAPVSLRLVILCGVWYTTSILSNTSSKAILTSFSKPVTLTLIQFAFVSGWCMICAVLARHFPVLKQVVPALKFPIRKPSRDLIMTTLPLTAFQIGGHILSSDAMSRIPVSLVHTIKGLSPLFTVLAYRFIFNIHYSSATYLSLIPLTLGVVMACSANFSGNFLGLLYAFGSAILFVTQNIVSKKLFNEAAQAEADGQVRKNSKPDKLNLLCYSSGLAFVFTAPIWLWSEGFTLMADFLNDASLELTERPGSLDHGRLALEFIFNGSFHFGQNLVAFVLLSMVSPVTYSVASLIKRVFVICFAIIWFGNKMTRIQGFGILLTFVGLYLYDRTSDAARADKRARMLQASNAEPLLPVKSDAKASFTSGFFESPVNAKPNGNGYAFPGVSGDEKKSDGPARQTNGTAWLPPGTKQEETWSPGDSGRGPVS